MSVQVARWQETLNGITRLSISEQLQILVALAQRFGGRSWLPSNLFELRYKD